MSLLTKFDYIFLSALSLIAVIALTSIALNYSGSLHLKIGADGIQLLINGENIKRLDE